MNNNERFNSLLNRCKHPRRVYAALLALAAAGFTKESLKEAEEAKV